MDENSPISVVEEAETAPPADGSNGSPRPRPWWTLKEIPKWLQNRTTLAVLGACAIVLVFLIVQYLHLARMADRRLAEGPFSTSTEILASPEVVAIGEPLTVDDLAGKLERSGYHRSPNHPGGSFTVLPNAILVSPGSSPADRVRVELTHGKVSGIVSIEDHSTLNEYQLGARLLTDLSEKREKRRLVSFPEIPYSLVQAVTSTEDKRFFHHGGFDYRRAIKAAYVDFRYGQKQQGASTLTMQLARGLWLDPGKSWRRKAEEILITLHLEHRLTKQQIFEDYANQVYLGRRGPYTINGFGEASRVFFGKELWQISTAEAALLAGMVQRPSYYNPYRYPERAVGRRNRVLALMLRNGKLTDADYHAAVASPLKLSPPETDESDNSYFLSMMNDELQTTLGDSAGQCRSVVTTLDPELQRAAEAAVRSGMDGVDRQLHRRNGDARNAVRPQVALIALDPHTGEIKALIGGRNYSDSQLNHVLAMRQPGSVFKPFVYAAAIETALNGATRIFTPASLVSDEPSSFSFNGQSYQPRDYHGDYQGDVTLRTALALSLNTATVSLAQQVGYARVVNLARRAGLNEAIGATPSVALGSYETTPLEIARAYTAFANDGNWIEPTTIRLTSSADGSVLSQHQVETRQALDPKVAYLLLNMMQEVLRSGTGAGVRSQGFILPAAGKTGTSHDGWFAGFTSQLLCVVWVGFDDDRELNLEGARSALPIWADFMMRAARQYPYSSAHEFHVPPGIVSEEICAETGQLAGPNCPKVRNEVFISGTEPTAVCDGQHDTGPTTTPDPGTR
jgi:penicillin-binding protein 1B